MKAVIARAGRRFRLYRWLGCGHGHTFVWWNGWAWSRCWICGGHPQQSKPMARAGNLIVPPDE